MKISWGKRQIFTNIGIILILVILYYWVVRLYFHINEWLTAIICLILLVLFNKYLCRLDNFISGAKGESKVRDILLNDLPKDYINLCNVSLRGRGNIDCILIGPTGIWTIEVKSHAGYIDFNGEQLHRGGKPFEKDFLKQAWAEAFSVMDFFKMKINKDYFVRPVIVFSNPRAKMKFGFNKVNGVYVVNMKWLSKLILGQIEILKNDEINRIINIIEDSRF